MPLRTWARSRPAAFAVTAAAAAAIVAATAAVTIGSPYFGSASAGYGGRASGTGALLIPDHLRNWGEVAANVPRGRLPDAADPAILAAGLAATIVLALGLWRFRAAFGPVDVFALAYLVLIFVWPFEDARFWLPLLPLALGYAYTVLRPLARTRARAALIGAYCAVFAAAGVAALAYDTRLTFSGCRFPDRYGVEGAGLDLRPTYRTAFGVARPGDEARVDPQALAVLRRYEPLARRRPTTSSSTCSSRSA